MLKLAYSPTSPFVRKVLICSEELGLRERIELESVTVTPIKVNVDYQHHTNPLSQIPALTLEDGSSLFDSGVICEYLDSLTTEHSLLPNDQSRWPVLTQHQLATGMNNALLSMRYESAVRPGPLRWDDWYQGQRLKVTQGMIWFENNPQSLQCPLNLAQIALGCTLAYCDFRFPEINWRPGHPGLSHWFKTFAQRPSFTTTAFTG